MRASASPNLRECWPHGLVRLTAQCGREESKCRITASRRRTGQSSRRLKTTGWPGICRVWPWLRSSFRLQTDRLSTYPRWRDELCFMPTRERADRGILTRTDGIRFLARAAVRRNPAPSAITSRNCDLWAFPAYSGCRRKIRPGSERQWSVSICLFRSSRMNLSN